MIQQRKLGYEQSREGVAFAGSRGGERERRAGVNRENTQCSTQLDKRVPVWELIKVAGPLVRLRGSTRGLMLKDADPDVADRSARARTRSMRGCRQVLSSGTKQQKKAGCVSLPACVARRCTRQRTRRACCLPFDVASTPAVFLSLEERGSNPSAAGSALSPVHTRILRTHNSSAPSARSKKQTNSLELEQEAYRDGTVIISFSRSLSLPSGSLHSTAHRLCRCATAVGCQ